MPLIEWEKKDNGVMKYPKFTCAPVCYDESGVNADGINMKTWSKVASIVLGYDQKIPITKMLLKAKQEFQIHKEM